MRRFAVSALASVVMSGSALAWNPPALDYSADETLETAEFSLDGRVYVSQGKERREMLIEGMRQIMINRPDKKLMWTLMPEQRIYIEMKLDAKDAESAADRGDISGYEIEQTAVGEEEVSGVMTTKSKIVMTGKNGEKMGGFWWMSKEGIVVKMDVIAMDKGDKTRVKKELTNIEIARQDPALFEIPEGYTQMGMMNMLMGGAGNADPGESGGDEQAPAPEAKKEKHGFGLKNIIDMVK